MPGLAERGKGSLDRSKPGEPPAGVPAALYAAIFQPGKSWKLAGTRKHSYYDGKPISSRSRFKGVCEVKSVERFAWGLLSNIDCGDVPKASVQSPLDAVWIATPEGLMRSHESLREGALDLSSFELVLPANPVAVDRTLKDAQEPQFGSRVVIARKGAAWCSDSSSWGGDEGWAGFCVDPKAGFVSSKWGWAGGSSDEVEVTMTSAK